MNLMNVVRVIMVSPTATFNNEFEGAAGSPAYLRTGSDGVKGVCVLVLQKVPSEGS